MPTWRDGAERKVGDTMKPTVESYTIAMPWYDRDEMPADYETWHRSAIAVMNAWLARGRALEIVTIRPAEFLAWLAETGLPNTAETRRLYVEQRASASHDVA